jgi:transposase
MLELRSLHYQPATATEPVLRDVSLQLAAGEPRLVAGRSGSGKSTLLELIGGLAEPDGGQILWNGEALNRRQRRWLCGLVFQFPERHFLGLTVGQELRLGQRRTGTEAIERVLQHFPIKRVVLVADRGLLSLDNLEEISKIKVGVRPLEFILAVPARRYGDFDTLLDAFHTETCQSATHEVMSEFGWQGHRLIVAHRPELAAELTGRRRARIAELEHEALRLTDKLEQQDAGKPSRGRKLSDSGAKARFYQAVCDAHLASILRVDLSSDLFAYDIDEKMRARAERIDGKLVLITNMPDHTPQEVVARYKALADIERGFRVLKSEIEIAPVFHRLPQRIRAHALICFLALVLYRVLRTRLRAHGGQYSPERALEIARRIQMHQVTLNQRHSAAGLTTLSDQQRELFDAVDLPVPVRNAL